VSHHSPRRRTYQMLSASRTNKAPTNTNQPQRLSEPGIPTKLTPQSPHDDRDDAEEAGEYREAADPDFRASLAPEPVGLDRPVDVVADRSRGLDRLALVGDHVFECRRLVREEASEPTDHLLLGYSQASYRQEVASQDDQALERGQALELVVRVELLLQFLGQLGAPQRHGQMLVYQRVDRQRGQTYSVGGRVVQCILKPALDEGDRPAVEREEEPRADQKTHGCRVDPRLVSLLELEQEKNRDCAAVR